MWKVLKWIGIAFLGLMILGWLVGPPDPPTGPIVPSQSCIAEVRNRLRATRNDFEQMAVEVCTAEQALLREQSSRRSDRPYRGSDPCSDPAVTNRALLAECGTARR